MIKTKVKIEDELIGVNVAQKAATDKILTESGLNVVKGFLTDASSRDNDILRMLGANSINNAIHEVHGAAIELEKAEDYYGNPIFSSAQIKNLCMKYKLKFLPSENFIGSLDIEVAAKIKQLEKQMTDSRDKDRAARENMSIENYRLKDDYQAFKFDNHQLKKQFSIMAPPAMFNLSVRPKPEKIRQVRDYDPVLFFDAGDGKWAMVHKWGKDFSVARSVKGFVYKNESTMLFTTFLIITSLLFLGLSSFTNVFINGNMIYNILAIAAVFLISPLLSILILPKSGSDVYTESGWNTPFKS